jgi:uncharacterized protein
MKNSKLSSNSVAFSNEHSKPWWRNTWCWLVLAGPLVVIIAGLATLWIAARDADPLVDRDYYQKGIAMSKGVDSKSNALEPARQARNHAATGGAVMPVQALKP